MKQENQLGMKEGVIEYDSPKCEEFIITPQKLVCASDSTETVGETEGEW